MNDRENTWFAVRYKINELKRFERNLLEQKFNFYIPRLVKKSKIIALFPGYAFIKYSDVKFNALKYTRGLISIVKFGNNYAFLNEHTIDELKELEEASKNFSLEENYLLGDDISIKSGPFKNYICNIVSLPSKDRVTVLLSLLGSKKSITFPIDMVKRA